MIKTAMVITMLAMLTFAGSAPAQDKSPVGPDPASRAVPGQMGGLEVFTATQKSLPAAGDDYYRSDLHTGYDIEDPSGRSVAFVANHMSDLDEWPDRAALPPGNYKIVAESTSCGWVTVPVVIEKGKITVVHLDNNWSKTPAGQLVFLPNGEAIGWLSRPAGTE